MKQITVISGKGGTGKTVLTACFAALSKNSVMVDCDVDAANLHLLLQPETIERHTFTGGEKARIIREICCECGECIRQCRFEAVREDFVIDSISCEGCALCVHICPYDAIVMEDRISGEWFVSNTPYGPFVHARLGIAEENSGKLVTQVRQTAKAIAEKQGADRIIIDGPPGIGCPVIASLTDTDLALAVTEPTLSGIHDMMRVFDLARHFQIPMAVVVNKWDLNQDRTKDVESFCKKNNIELLGRISFAKEVPLSLVQGIPFVQYAPDAQVSAEIHAIWEKLDGAMSKGH